MSAFVIAALCAMGSAAAAQTPAKADAKKAATKEAGKPAAKAPKEAPASATLSATCKDGTTYTGKTKKGACSKHGGVKSWDKA